MIEALAASSVKITGRDVVATWKLMVAVFMIPTFYLFYAIITTEVLRRYNIIDGTFYPQAAIFFLIIFVTISYAGVRTFEVGRDCYK